MIFKICGWVLIFIALSLLVVGVCSEDNKPPTRIWCLVIYGGFAAWILMVLLK